MWGVFYVPLRRRLPAISNVLRGGRSNWFGQLLSVYSSTVQSQLQSAGGRITLRNLFIHSLIQLESNYPITLRLQHPCWSLFSSGSRPPPPSLTLSLPRLPLHWTEWCLHRRTNTTQRSAQIWLQIVSDTRVGFYPSWTWTWSSVCWDAGRCQNVWKDLMLWTISLSN